MTKYLDSKGLSYLWQKIKAELALKSDNHEHPYLGWVSGIKAADAGKVVVFGTPVYDKDGVLTSLPTAVGHSLGRDVASTSVFADEAYVRLGETTKIQLSTITETPEGGQATSYNVWDIPFATSDKIGVVRTGKADFTEPTGTSDWHKAPILDGYVWYQNTLADANTVTAAADLTENQIVLGAGTKGIKVNGNKISSTFGATAASATAVPTESAVAGYVTASSFVLEDKTVGVGESAKTSKYLVLKDKYNAEIASIDATDFLVDGMLDKVEYKTVERELEGGAKETVTTDILVLTWNTDAGKQVVEVDLSKYIDVYTAGSGIAISDHEISVKTTGIPADATPNVSTDVNAEGNVVGYVDLSAYQKSADLVAFDQTDMDAIFAAAEADLAANKGVPTFPTADPLVKEEPAQPAE